MTLRKISILSAAAFIAVTGMVQAAVTPLLHVTIEYEYARDGEIVSRTVNGKVQRYAYDRRGQLTGIYDADGQAVEAYTYDAAGNILKKTVNGKTTTFTYDAANQLVSKQDDSGLTAYEYDAAGRMIREGDKEYRYSYLDKITSVIENGETAAMMDYFVGGQLASVTRGLDTENFVWDGLALVHRDGSDYLNEPAIGGGNPVASDGKVMFNDMLGSTVAVRGEEGYSMTSMTAFGESSDSGAFFTGKPFVGELGYAFLMRSYRPENGKWQTADPMGYPDGWNQLAYCNNHTTSSVDLWGCGEWYLRCISVTEMQSLSMILPTSHVFIPGGSTSTSYELTGCFGVLASTMNNTKTLTIESFIDISLRTQTTVTTETGGPVTGDWIYGDSVSVYFSTTYSIDSQGGISVSGNGSVSNSASGTEPRTNGSSWNKYIAALTQVVPTSFPDDAGGVFNHQTNARFANDQFSIFSGMSVTFGGIGLNIDFKGEDLKSPLYTGIANIKKVYIE